VPASLAVTLPHGIRVGSEWTRDARIRSLTGEEEEFLRGEGAGLRPVERTTALLARCVESVGPAEPSALVAELTVGDREALLLQLRRLTFGDRLDAVVACPVTDCGERLDVELSVAELLVEPYAEEGEWQEVRVESGGATRTVRFRAPTGADQAAAAGLAPDLEEAARALIERCVEGAGVDDALARVLPGLMSERDPQAELMLSLDCPACGRGFRVLFDTGDYLQRELTARGDELYEEVHQLALHYHWSEREIMAMPTGKRRRYLELLAQTFEGTAA